jgi:probable rRNA maturation factor
MRLPRSGARVVAVDLVIEDSGWNEVQLGALAQAACAAALAVLGLDPDRYEISLLGCNDARIAALNADFRGKPQPTNVLSWPATDIALPLGRMPELPVPGAAGDPVELGDIAIAHETCAAEAAAQGKPFDDHVRHLLAHATLHLLGFDHIKDADAALMQGLETRILETLGIPDPY